jgi:hypothetical protein
MKLEHTVHSICETTELYRIGWRDHVLRMPDSCSAKTVELQAKRMPAFVRLKKRWKEQM